MAATKGVMRSLTNDWTMPLKAAPTTKATAISTVFPRMMNFLKPDHIAVTILYEFIGSCIIIGDGVASNFVI